MTNFRGAVVLPFKEPKQETGDKKCLPTRDETLADSDDTPQHHLDTGSHWSVWTALRSCQPTTYGIQLSGPTFLLTS